MIRIIVTFANQSIPAITFIVGSRNHQTFKKYEFAKNKINGESRIHKIPIHFPLHFTSYLSIALSQNSALFKNSKKR